MSFVNPSDPISPLDGTFEQAQVEYGCSYQVAVSKLTNPVL